MKKKNLAVQRFYWPQMEADIKFHVQKQCRCLVNKEPNIKERADLVPIESSYPFQIICIDFCKLDLCKGRFQYAMVVTDHFTKYVQIYATKNKTTRTAADKLYNDFILQYGFPERIHSDQGGEFNSKLFTEMQKMLGIDASTTTPYHPQGNGMAERFNRTMCNMLKALPAVAKGDWRKHLPKLAFAYNSTKNKTTGFSPFYLMYGRESKLPVDGMFQDVNAGDKHYTTHEQFAKDWEDSMNKACEIVKKNMKKAADYNKGYFDKKSKAVEISVGDMVLMKNVREKGGTGKLKTYWEESIFEVVEKKENLPVYRIQNIRKARDARVVHRNLLMKCNELPLDVFDKPKSPGKAAQKSQQKAKQNKTQQSTTTSDVAKAQKQKQSVRFSRSTTTPNVAKAQKQNVRASDQLDVKSRKGQRKTLVVAEEEMVDDVEAVGIDSDDDILIAVYDEPALVEGEETDAGQSEDDEGSENDHEGSDVGESDSETLALEESGVESDSETLAYSESDAEAELELPETEAVLESDTDHASSSEENYQSADAESDTSSEEDEPIRRTRRVPVPKKVFSYDKMGGTPVLVPSGQQ